MIFRDLTSLKTIVLFTLILLMLSFLASREVQAIVCSCRCGISSHGIPYCAWRECQDVCGWNCTYEYCYYCTNCGGCFMGETEVEGEKLQNSKTQKLQIKDLEEGDIVSSFNPETGEIKEGMVSDVTKATREGYYELETESGKKVEVTAEHPLLAVKNESFIAKLRDIFSHIPINQLISDLQVKVNEILR